MSFRIGASHRIRVSIVLMVFLLVAQHPAPTRRNIPLDSFERAKQLAWLNNWAEASHVLGRLQRSGHLDLDERNAILARAVEVRGNIESLSPRPRRKNWIVCLRRCQHKRTRVCDSKFWR